MSKIITILVPLFFCAISLDVCAAPDDPVNHVKRHLHDQGAARPIRNAEWYLKQARESERFKAIALESDGARFSSEYMMADHLVQQATIPNHPVVEKHKATEDVPKKDSSAITFMFVPAFLSNKLMDLQKRTDLHPTVTMSWQE